MATFKIRDKETGQVFTIKEKTTPTEQPKTPISALLGKTPTSLEKSGNWVQSGLLKTGEDIYKEGVSPILSGGSTFGLGIPKLLARAQGKEDLIYPEQETALGKGLRGVSETAGFIAGAPGKLTLKAGQLIPKLATETLKRKSLRWGLEGATAGATMTPKEGYLAPKERAQNALFTGVLSAGIPPAMAGGKKAITGVGKGLGSAFRSIGGVSKETVNWIKERGATHIVNPIKREFGFIKDKLAPVVDRVVQEDLKRFTPNIQNWAIKVAKVPETAIKTIKKHGIENLNNFRRSLNDSTDVIYQKIKQGLDAKKLQADELYQKALENYNGPLNSESFHRALKTILIREKVLNVKGEGLKNPTSPIMEKLRDIYLSKGDALKTMDKTDFSQFRDYLGGLLREIPNDRNIMELKNALYGSAEKSGVVGIQAARDLENKAFQASKQFPDTLIKESNLDKLHNLSEATVRQLKNLEEYIGVPFLDDLNKLTSARETDKIFNKININTIESLLAGGVNPKNTGSVQRKLANLLGEKTAKRIVNHIKDHAAALDLYKGSKEWMTRAGIVAKASKVATQKYFEKGLPSLQKTQGTTSKVINKLSNNPLGQFIKKAF